MNIAIVEHKYIAKDEDKYLIKVVPKYISKD